MSSIEYDLSTDDSDDDALNLPGLANNGVPGLLVSVEFDDNLSDPVIDNGKVRMPRVSSGGGFSRPVEFGSGIASPISGVLVGMSFATGIGEIFAKGGEVYFPLAEYNGYYGTNVAGALVGVQYATGIDAPRINNGMLELPEAGGAAVQAAEFIGNITTSVEPGGLKGAEFRMDVSNIEANDGLLRFPLAATVDYSFVPMSTAVAGAIAGIRYAPRASDPESGGTSITKPRILPGGLIELPPEDGDSVLRGLVDDDGNIHTWEQVAGYVGSQVPVAGLQLRLAENFYATFMLNVGIKDGYLSFNFSY